MGGPKMTVSRSNSSKKSAKVPRVSKSNKIRNNKKKKDSEEQKIKKTRRIKNKEVSKERDLFERNILDQSFGASEEADKAFKATLTSKIGKKIIKDTVEIKTPLVSKKKEEMEKEDLSEVLDGLDEILKVPENRVTKLETDGISASEIKKPYIPKSLDIGSPGCIFKEGENSKTYEMYDYGKIDSSEVSFTIASKKEVEVILSVENPNYLYGRNDFKTRVVYITKNHPLYKKILTKAGGSFVGMYISKTSLNGIIFREVLDKLYSKVKNSYLFEQPFRVITKEYTANIILSDLIFDYEDTAYYTLFELVGTEIKRAILVNVDVIFSN